MKANYKGLSAEQEGARRHADKMAADVQSQVSMAAKARWSVQQMQLISVDQAGRAKAVADAVAVVQACVTVGALARDPQARHRSTCFAQAQHAVATLQQEVSERMDNMEHRLQQLALDMSGLVITDVWCMTAEACYSVSYLTSAAQREAAASAWPADSLPDYALESGGGRVVVEHTSRYVSCAGRSRWAKLTLIMCRTFGQSYLQSLLGIFPGNEPRTILQVGVTGPRYMVCILRAFDLSTATSPTHMSATAGHSTAPKDT